MEKDELELLFEARAELDRGEELDASEDLICECECVSIEDIREFSGGQTLNLQQLIEHFNLGAGCSSCVKNFEMWKARI